MMSGRLSEVDESAEVAVAHTENPAEAKKSRWFTWRKREAVTEAIEAPGDPKQD